jgi:hypothetical protein
LGVTFFLKFSLYYKKDKRSRTAEFVEKKFAWTSRQGFQEYEDHKEGEYRDQMRWYAEVEEIKERNLAWQREQKERRARESLFFGPSKGNWKQGYERQYWEDVERGCFDPPLTADEIEMDNRLAAQLDREEGSFDDEYDDELFDMVVTFGWPRDITGGKEP